MVSNKLDYEGVKTKAKELDFPESVLEFFEGFMGQPFKGFPLVSLLAVPCQQQIC